MSETLEAEDPQTPERAAAALRDGQLVVLPTDTVYGVAADAFQPAATRRLLRARGGGRNRPLSLLIRSPRQVVGLAGDVPEAADRLLAAYWPGPLTVVLRAAPGMSWDLGNDAGTVALRIPTDELLLGLIKEIGPLACTGAKRRGRPQPATVEQAREQLGDAVACYVDGGERLEAASTIVDATHGETIRVLRAAAIPSEHVEQVAAGRLDWGARPEAMTEEPGDPVGGREE